MAGSLFSESERGELLLLDDHECVGEDDERLRLVVHHGRECLVDFVRRARLEGAEREPELFCRALHLPVFVRLVAILRIEEYCDAQGRRHQLCEELQPFRRDVGRDAGEPGRLASGTRNACDEAVERIADDDNDRNGAGRLLGGPQALIGPGEQGVDIQAGELSGKLRQAAQFAVGGPDDDVDVLALDVSQIMKTLVERTIDGVRGRSRLKPAEPGDLGGLLGVRRDRHGRDADDRQESGDDDPPSPVTSRNVGHGYLLLGAGKLAPQGAGLGRAIPVGAAKLGLDLLRLDRNPLPHVCYPVPS
jgi:hypothetical protein